MNKQTNNINEAEENFRPVVLRPASYGTSDSFGLPEVSARAIKPAGPPVTALVVAASKKKTEREGVSIIAILYVVVVLLLFASSFNYYYYSNIYSNSGDMEEMPVIEIPVIEENYIYPDTIPYFLNVSPVIADTLYPDSMINDSASNAAILDIESESTGIKRFQVVAGMFNNEQNAKEYIRQLKNKGAKVSLIKTKNKKFRVIFGEFETLKEAETNLMSSKKVDNNAWILILN